MDLSGLYELLERFHRSNQLPAFLIGFVAALGSRLLRSAVLSVADSQRSRLGTARSGHSKSESTSLTAENKQLQNDLRHTEKHAEVIKTRLSELSGRLKAQTEITSDLSARMRAAQGTAAERGPRETTPPRGLPEIAAAGREV